MPPEAPASVPQRQLSLPQQIPIEIVILFFYFNESIVIHNIFIHHAVFKFYCFENQYKKIFIQNWIFCLNGRQSEKLHKNRYLKVLAQDRKPESRAELSRILDLGEGTVRSILDILKENNFLESNKNGHYLSPKGDNFVQKITLF